MLKIKLNIYVFLFIWVSLLSCKKDNQDFTYAKINELQINADSVLSINQFDTLKINPQILQSKPGAGKFTYQWKIYPVQIVADFTPMIISTDESLNAVISVPPLLGGYHLEYKVTSTDNGVAAFKMFTVNVTSVFSDGWVISSSKDGNAELSFVRSDYRVFYTPAVSVNQTVYPGHAIGTYVYPISDGTQLGIGFFTDKGNYRFSANDFLQTGTSVTSFTPAKDKFTFSLSKFKTEEYVINDGSLYAASIFDGPLNVTYTERLSGDYYFFPKVITSTLFNTYFYDNKNKRFMSVAFGGFYITPAFGSSSTAFNMGNTDMLMVGAMDGPQTSSSGVYYFVMENSNGERYLYSLSGAQPGLNQKILNSPEIESAHSFASSLLLRQMYYATDNKIYQYDILANSSTLIYTFPAGTSIKQIEVQPDNGKTLVVAANAGSTGQVYFFNLDNLGNISNNTYSQMIDGFGEIANIAYRKRN